MRSGPDRHQHAVSDAADAVSERSGETASEKIQPTGRSVPDTEVAAGAKRRRFSAEYKMRIVGQAGRCREPGEIGSLLRREGLYSSHLAKWRAEHARGAMKALAGSDRGPRPKRQAAEIENEGMRRTIGQLDRRPLIGIYGLVWFAFLGGAIMKESYPWWELSIRCAVIPVFCLIALAGTHISSYAQNAGDPLAAKTLSPEALLRPDGTIALDGKLSGAVDLRGWDVTLDGHRGPVLKRQHRAPASPLATGWSTLANYGLNNPVRAMAVIGSDLYVGGEFTQTADGSVTNLNYIAKYSAGTWSALANQGLNDIVYCLAVIGSDLYVGGSFSQTADGSVTNLKYIAKYSADTWSALANHGLNGAAITMAVIGSDLFVGGLWITQTADGSVTNLNHIAKYSAGTWSALANHGLNNFVWTLAVIGSDLYVGGYFSQTADGSVTNLNHIAKYSAGTWSALANQGLNDNVYVLAVSGSDLYVGGLFTQTADASVTNLNHIAKYSAGTWSALANQGLDNVQNTIAVTGSDLYVGGVFTQTADGIVTGLNRIAKYSAGTWSALPNQGLDDRVWTLAVIGSDLYVGGFFTQTADGIVTNLYRIAKLTLGPTITSITSKTGKPGKTATINGGGFSASKTNNKVYFGKYSATVTKASTSKITIKIPTKCKSGKTYGVYVNVMGTKTNTIQYKVK